MKEFLNLIEEFKISVFNFNIFVGIIAGISVFVFEIVLLRKYKRKDKRTEKAKQSGHVIPAKRVNIWDDGTSGDNVNSYFHAKYSYQVNQKNYFYRYLGKAYPPPNINLYYKNSPKHVWSDFNKKQSPMVILLYLVPIVIMIAVVYMLGGI